MLPCSYLQLHTLNLPSEDIWRPQTWKEAYFLPWVCLPTHELCSWPLAIHPSTYKSAKLQLGRLSLLELSKLLYQVGVRCTHIYTELIIFRYLRLWQLSFSISCISNIKATYLVDLTFHISHMTLEQMWKYYRFINFGFFNLAWVSHSTWSCCINTSPMLEPCEVNLDFCYYPHCEVLATFIFVTPPCLKSILLWSLHNQAIPPLGRLCIVHAIVLILCQRSQWRNCSVTTAGIILAFSICQMVLFCLSTLVISKSKLLCKYYSKCIWRSTNFDLSKHKYHVHYHLMWNTNLNLHVVSH